MNNEARAYEANPFEDDDADVCEQCLGFGEVECDECGGAGSVDRPCAECRPDGEDIGGDDPECLVCGGSGKSPADCPECGGSGEVDCAGCLW